MTSSETIHVRVWTRPLGHAWKVRVDSDDSARRVGESLGKMGWRCTSASPAFDAPGMFLFRATRPDVEERASLNHDLEQLSWVELMTDPA